jgi:hypothetical protein
MRGRPQKRSRPPQENNKVKLKTPEEKSAPLENNKVKLEFPGREVGPTKSDLKIINKGDVFSFVHTHSALSLKEKKAQV